MVNKHDRSPLNWLLGSLIKHPLFGRKKKITLRRKMQWVFAWWVCMGERLLLILPWLFIKILFGRALDGKKIFFSHNIQKLFWNHPNKYNPRWEEEAQKHECWCNVYQYQFLLDFWYCWFRVLFGPCCTRERVWLLMICVKWQNAFLMSTPRRQLRYPSLISHNCLKFWSTVNLRKCIFWCKKT